MIIDKFKSKIDQRTVDTIIVQIERAIEKNYKYIELNPIYQRAVVWSDEKQSNFINSVIRGIVPNNLILNLDTLNSKEICLDGKQRITSLLRFKNNEIPCKFILDNDKEEFYYFDCVPKEYIKNDKYKILPINQKNKFLNETIIFVTYIDLSYDDQVDIFTRIQHGVALSEGEKLGSTILDENVNIKFNEFCDSKKLVMQKFNGKRDNHKIIITNIMIMIMDNLKVLKIATKPVRNKFLKDLKVDTLKKIFEKITPLINFAFGEKVLGNKTITKRISPKIIFATLFWLHKHTLDLNHKNLINNTENQKKLRSVIRKIHKSRNKRSPDDVKSKLLKDFKKIQTDELTDEEGEIIMEEKTNDSEEILDSQ